MRFFADDLSIEIPVEWYFVPDDRNHVPYGHAFGSRNWEDVPGPPLLGEVPGTARYYGGEHANDLLGIGLCGTKDQWENGPSVLDKPRPLNPTTGRQCCCGRGIIQNEVGPLAGIETEVEEFTEVPAYSVTFSAGAPIPPFSIAACCSALNNTWLLANIGTFGGITNYRDLFNCPQNDDRPIALLVAPSFNLLRLSLVIVDPFGGVSATAIWQAPASGVNLWEPFSLSLVLGNQICVGYPPASVTLTPIFI